jgi:uncharacterized protein
MVWRTSSQNKETVQAYMDAYSRWDHIAVLACLTDDIEWIIPGAFHLEGKDAFDAEIESKNNAGPPQISVDRLVEEDDIVVAEGQVRQPLAAGGNVGLAYCGVFQMRDGKICKLTSYVMKVESQNLL